MGEVSSDMAVILAGEVAIWLQNLGAKGALPRVFTGITREGKQAIVILTGLPFDHVQRREFIVWLCRHEKFVAYAYATHVGVADDDFTVTEALDIYASSDRHDVSITFSIKREANGIIQFCNRRDIILPAKLNNGVFFGLQRSSQTGSDNDHELFRTSWDRLTDTIVWQQRQHVNTHVTVGHAPT